MTLVETLFSSALSAVVVLASISLFMFGSYNWLLGQAHLNAESSSEIAIQQIENVVREAMNVSVDSNGNALDFQMPQKNPDGTYVIPLVWDGVNRRIALNNGQITLTTDQGLSQVICNDVSAVDPLSEGGDQSYQIFTAGSAGTIRSLTIMVATTESDAQTTPINSRSRDTVYLRNVPELVQ